MQTAYTYRENVLTSAKSEKNARRGYRFLYNGKEIDNEGLGGGGSSYDYGFRIYNPQIARFLSVDPLTSSYPWYTPYQFAGNMPVWAFDIDGLEDIKYNDGALLDKKFGKAIDLMLSTNMGLNAVKSVWNTANKSIKQDVYMTLSNDPKLFNGAQAFVATFDQKAIKNGKFLGEYKDDNGKLIKLQFSNKSVIPALKKIDFTLTSSKDLDNANVSVIFINKPANDKESSLSYATTIFHELQAHIVRNIDLLAQSPKRNQYEDHEEFHGNKTYWSPRVGDEKPGSIMTVY